MHTFLDPRSSGEGPVATKMEGGTESGAGTSPPAVCGEAFSGRRGRSCPGLRGLPTVRPCCVLSWWPLEGTGQAWLPDQTDGG